MGDITLKHEINSLGEPVLTGLFNDSNSKLKDYVIIDGHVFERLDYMSVENHLECNVEIDGDIADTLKEKFKDSFVSSKEAVRSVLRDHIKTLEV